MKNTAAKGVKAARVTVDQGTTLQSRATWGREAALCLGSTPARGGAALQASPDTFSSGANMREGEYFIQIDY